MNDPLKINLHVDGRSYPLTIDRADEALYRIAAEQLSKKLNQYRQIFEREGKEKVAIMAALDFAYRYTKMQDKNDTEPYRRQIERWGGLVEEALSEEKERQE